MKLNKESLLSLAQGAIQEKVAIEAEKIFNNILDLNTHPDKTRSMTIKLDFTPHQNRKSITLKVGAKSNLQHNCEVVTQLQIGIDSRSGKIIARELLPQIEGQLDFEGKETPPPVILNFNNSNHQGEGS